MTSQRSDLGELELLQKLTARLQRMENDGTLTRSDFQAIYREASEGLKQHPEGIEAITIYAKSEDWIPA